MSSVKKKMNSKISYFDYPNLLKLKEKNKLDLQPMCLNFQLAAK